MKKLSEFWNNSSRVARIMFWILMSIGVTLMVCSFILPPVGVIDNSVLLAFGEVQTFAALGVGLSCLEKGMDITLQKGDTNLTIGKQKNE